MDCKEIILTGDRPTGPLHLGHYIGSLENRVRLQDTHKQYILIADMQALTDNYGNPEKVRNNIIQVAMDYLAVGIDPEKSTIFIQSLVPEIAELAVIYLNLVTIARLKRNPTVKNEIQLRGFKDDIPAGFLMYPVHQAADITCVKGTLVPAGDDQLPIIEQANEIIRTFNRIYNTKTLCEARGLVTPVSRLMGIDGKAKMSKSLGNAIFLSDSADLVSKKVMSMYTDPEHIRATDPGKIEGNVVFAYLDAFDGDKQQVQKLKEQYQKGGLGDVVVKKRLIDVLNHLLDPIRDRRIALSKDPGHVLDVIFKGTDAVCDVAQKTFQEVRAAMGIDYTRNSLVK